MRRTLPRWPLLLCLVSLVTGLGFGPPALLDTDATSHGLTRGQVRELLRYRVPPELGTAVALMDLDTGHIVFEQRARERRPIASLTKIMTALVALERGQLADQVRITPAHVAEGSVMGLLPGDVISLEGLLWGLLLPSGNDAALAIAEHVGGTVENFVALMNMKAKELGLKDTQFRNPHGLDDPQHYSTAWDLAVLTREALRNPVFARMVATPTVTVTGSRPFFLSNSNPFLHSPELLPGATTVDGVKTGRTDNAGDCLVLSWRSGDRRLLAVFLDSGGRVPAAVGLANYMAQAFRWQPLPTPAPYLLRYQDDETVFPVEAEQPPQTLMPAWGRPPLQIQLREWTVRREPNPGLVGSGVLRYLIGHQSLPFTLQLWILHP
jgi:D-alanyl-D-alanine carboxypeptidase